MNDLGKFHNEMGIGSLPERRYENIFKMYTTDDNHKYYNILQHVHLPKDLTTDCYEVTTIPPHTPLTVLSYRIYGTMDLWWLICIANGIDDPTQFIPTGVDIRIIKPGYVNSIIQGIQEQLQLL